MSIYVYASGEMATSRARGEMKAVGHGDGWDVVGEGGVEVSGWVTGWRVGMHIQREKLEGSAGPGSWSALSASAFPRPSTAPGTQALSKYLPNGWRAKSAAFEATVQGLRLVRCVSAVCQAHYFSSLGFSFLICKMGMINEAPSWVVLRI